jgi:hypothetical protein
MKRTILLAALLALGGCGTPIPFDGQTADGERFSGTLTAEGRERGPLEMRNADGVTCTGSWQLDTDLRGAAFLMCSDGRTGTAELSSLETPGKMRGMLGGRPFKGTYERSPF